MVRIVYTKQGNTSFLELVKLRYYPDLPVKDFYLPEEYEEADKDSDEESELLRVFHCHVAHTPVARSLKDFPEVILFCTDYKVFNTMKKRFPHAHIDVWYNFIRKEVFESWVAWLPEGILPTELREVYSGRVFDLYAHDSARLSDFLLNSYHYKEPLTPDPTVSYIVGLGGIPALDYVGLLLKIVRSNSETDRGINLLTKRAFAFWGRFYPYLGLSQRVEAAQGIKKVLLDLIEYTSYSSFDVRHNKIPIRLRYLAPYDLSIRNIDTHRFGVLLTCDFSSIDALLISYRQRYKEYHEVF